MAFASRSLSECNYLVIEREVLAAAWSVEHFRTFLWGLEFYIHTDHKPLVKVLSPGGAGKGSARLASLLQEYRYQVSHIPGWQNAQANCLSRLSLRSKCGQSESSSGGQD